MAPDYNDGCWHGYNGGGCPVHPESELEAVCETASGHTGYGRVTWKKAKDMMWDDTPQPIVAFRVVKEYREPRQWWIPMFGDFCGPPCETEADARAYHPDTHKIIHVREVMEGEAQ